MAASPAIPASESRSGWLYGVSAYLCWGLLPIWFKAVTQVPVFELLAHRVTWMALFLLLLLKLRGRAREVAATIGDRARLPGLLLSTTLIGLNWLVFLFAILQARLVEASLGYFLNPLISVLLGVVFLGESLRPLQLAAVTLAGSGVAWLATAQGQLPWISLVLATTFGVYGLLRKTMRTDALVGLAVESCLLLPIMLGWLLRSAATDTLVFAHQSRATDVLLVLAGPVTAVPLLLFVAGARRLPLSTMGFLQYLAPTLQFLLAVLVWDEPFGRAQAIAFGLIWMAVLLYLGDALLAGRFPRRNAGCGRGVSSANITETVAPEDRHPEAPHSRPATSKPRRPPETP